MIEHFCSDKISLLPEKVVKYLKKFGESKYSVLLQEEKQYEMIVVIPAIAEYENIQKLLSSLIKTDAEYHRKFLILFVINNTENAKPEITEENEKTFSLLKELIEKDSAGEILNNGELSFGVIDVFSRNRAMPKKHGGVGLARKIGLDCALTLLDYSYPNQKLLISLDADCTVSENYFTEIYKQANLRKIKAGHVNFEHRAENSPYSEAIIQYEIFLRYYVLGLKYAGSLFAFFTIGSTMLSDWEAYIKIGGMNKKKAAEDFYFMEKLAKNYKIEVVSEAFVYPSPRTSWRVPFGTGKSVSEFLQGNKKYKYLYSPEIFEILKKWNEIFLSEDVSPPAFYLENAKKINKYLYNFLVEKEFEKAWTRIYKEFTNRKQINKQKLYWFDGFMTLKLVHYLRDNCCANVLNIDAVTTLLKKQNKETTRKIAVRDEHELLKLIKSSEM